MTRPAKGSTLLQLVQPGRWIVTSGNGVCFVLEDLHITGSAGSTARGWWLRCLRGPRARTRYLRHIEHGGPPVEMHEVGTFPTSIAAVDGSKEHARQARREGTA